MDGNRRRANLDTFDLDVTLKDTQGFVTQRERFEGRHGSEQQSPFAETSDLGRASAHVVTDQWMTIDQPLVIVLMKFRPAGATNHRPPKPSGMRLRKSNSHVMLDACKVDCFVDDTDQNGLLERRGMNGFRSEPTSDRARGRARIARGSPMLEIDNISILVIVENS